MGQNEESRRNFETNMGDYREFKKSLKEIY